MRGGDDDLPTRPSLAARRAKTDALRVRQDVITGGVSDYDDYDDGGVFDGHEGPLQIGGKKRKGGQGEEDEFYKVC